MFFKKKKENANIDFDRLPKHIAFIMDGNGRWAKSRGQLRTYGHKVGAEALGDIIKHAQKLGIKYVSFFAFSTENWDRPKDEVNEIFRILREMIKQKKDSIINSDMRLMTMGDISRLPSDVVSEINDVIEKTKDHKGITVNIALNYGSRIEILRAINNIIKDGLKEVDEKTFRKYLYTSMIPDPDLVIRTSGEQRLSNFLMFQSAYSELYFPKTHWPDFREKELEKAIIEFQSRDRRFGKIKG